MNESDRWLGTRFIKEEESSILSSRYEIQFSKKDNSLKNPVKFELNFEMAENEKMKKSEKVRIGKTVRCVPFMRLDLVKLSKRGIANLCSGKWRKRRLERFMLDFGWYQKVILLTAQSRPSPSSVWWWTCYCSLASVFIFCLLVLFWWAITIKNLFLKNCT